MNDETLINACQEYFNVWNAQDVDGIKGCFSDNGSLRDWDVEVSGNENVAQANANIFNNVPKIHIDILSIHPSSTTKTAACEIIVNLNDDSDTKLKVVDVVEFDDDMKIVSLRAYKG